MVNAILDAVAQAPAAPSAVSGGVFAALRADRYEPHPLHATERIWSETNCYVDLWVEVLHALGHEPLACGAFALSTDFDGDQWTFFKPPPEDLRELYGIEVAEMNVWRPLAWHIGEQLDRGRLLTVEVDSWFLPDTREVSYRLEHQKTTIAPAYIDAEERQLGYFHGAGFYELSGEDFDGVLRAGTGIVTDPGSGSGNGSGADASDGAPCSLLPPYVELVRLERRTTLGPDELARRARRLALAHLDRRPAGNPVRRLGERIASDLPWLAEQGPETFHGYAFGTCRQCGASAELAAAFVGWLAGQSAVPHEGNRSATLLREVAEGAKTLQFGLARAAAGRRFDLPAVVESMAVAWDSAIDGLAAWLA